MERTEREETGQRETTASKMVQMECGATLTKAAAVAGDTQAPSPSPRSNGEVPQPLKELARANGEIAEEKMETELGLTTSLPDDGDDSHLSGENGHAVEASEAEVAPAIENGQSNDSVTDQSESSSRASSEQSGKFSEFDNSMIGYLQKQEDAEGGAVDNGAKCEIETEDASGNSKDHAVAGDENTKDSVDVDDAADGDGVMDHTSGVDSQEVSRAASPAASEDSQSKGATDATCEGGKKIQVLDEESGTFKQVASGAAAAAVGDAMETEAGGDGENGDEETGGDATDKGDDGTVNPTKDDAVDVKDNKVTVIELAKASPSKEASATSSRSPDAVGNKAPGHSVLKPVSAKADAPSKPLPPSTSLSVKPDRHGHKMSKIGSVIHTTSNASGSTPDSMRPMAKICFEVGLDMVRQNVYKDLIKIQGKKQNAKKLSDKEVKQLDKLRDAYDHLIFKNEPYVVDCAHECKVCGFKAELNSVLELHLEYAHQNVPNFFRCSFCEYTTRLPGEFYFHMEAEHNRKGRIFAPLAIYCCPHCPFEHNYRNAYGKHSLKCEKTFKLYKNLEPTPADCDIPLKQNKPLPAPAVQAPPKPAPAVVPRAAPPAPVVRQTIAPTSTQVRFQVPVGFAPPTVQPMQLPGMAAPQRLVQMGGQYYSLVYQGGQAFLTPLLQQPVVAAAAVAKAMAPQVQRAAVVAPAQTRIAVSAPPPAPRPAPTTPPRTSAGIPPQAMAKKTPPANAAGKKFEVCEICGGFVKDREALRIHFYWAHKVDLHPGVLNRKNATLGCRDCSQRFWTYQGLQRHNGLVHQKNADAGKGGVTCQICYKGFVKDYLGHLHAVHPVAVGTLLPSKKCLVCYKSCGTLKSLEEHMLSSHKDLVKHSSSILALFTAYCPKDALELAREKQAERQRLRAEDGGGDDAVPTGLFKNDQIGAIKCTRCSALLTTKEAVKQHFYNTHGHVTEQCPLCDDTAPIGYPLVTHIKVTHCKKLKVRVARLSRVKEEQYMEKRKRSPVNLLPEPSAAAAVSPSVVIVDDEESSPPAKRARTDDEQVQEDNEAVSPSPAPAAMERTDDAEPPEDVSESAAAENGTANSSEHGGDKDADTTDDHDGPKQDMEVDALGKNNDGTAHAETEQPEEDGRKSPLEEVMEVDGEMVIVKQQVDDDEDEEGD